MAELASLKNMIMVEHILIFDSNAQCKLPIFVKKVQDIGVGGLNFLTDKNWMNTH